MTLSSLFLVCILFLFSDNSGTLVSKHVLNSSYQGRDAEGQQVFGIASGTLLGTAWKGLEAANVPGSKLLESRAKARVLGDG